MKKSVSFAGQNKRIVYDVNSDEKKQSWYNRHEYREIRKEIQTTALLVRLGITDYIEQQKEHQREQQQQQLQSNNHTTSTDDSSNNNNSTENILQTHEENFCVRGLEANVSPREGQSRLLKRRLLIGAILQEQLAQKRTHNGQVVDPEAVRGLSELLSADALLDAVQRALGDAQSQQQQQQQQQQDS